MNKIILLCIAYIALLPGCKKPNFTELTRSDKRVRYFTSFISYKLPIRPIGEISFSEVSKANNRYSFYEASYDQTGKLVMLNKHYNDKVLMQVKYFYNPNDCIVKCELTHPFDPNSELIEQYFNESGKFIKARVFDNKGRLIEED